jgi:hypothetical protein
MDLSMDDERPKANPMPTSPPEGYHAPKAEKPKASMMDSFRNFVTGGASGALDKAVNHRNMNYLKEDDGK